jgi:hypothetical protein
MVMPANEDHCRELGQRMRLADALECARSGGYLPHAAALLSLRASAEAWAVLVDGKVLGLWGIVEVERGAGVAWALTTGEVETHAMSFWRLSKAVVAEMRTRWPLLWNYVDADYPAALRWLARLGFDVAPPAPFGLFGLPFQRVTLRS